MKFPHYRQFDQMDCGPTCLRMIAKFYGKHYSAQTLRDLTQISREGVSLLGIAEGAEAIGMRAIGIKLSVHKLINDLPLPCILHWGQNHFVVLYRIEDKRSFLGRDSLSRVWGGRKMYGKLKQGINQAIITESGVPSDESFREGRSNKADDQLIENKSVYSADFIFHVADPSSGHVSYNLTEFSKKWFGNISEGIALVIEPSQQFFTEQEEPSQGIRLSQLIGYLWQYRSLIYQLLIGALLGTALSMVAPFLAQSVVDIGIGTQDIAFINLILIAELALLVGNASISVLRGWILLHISSRLNLTILSEFLSKLMRLPISFFDTKQFGDLIQRVGDHHRVESFLTGQSLTLLFSLINLIFFGFVLAYFDVIIFFVTLVSSVLYVIWVVLFLNQRRKLDRKRFEISAQSQGQLIQLIHGMQEIKIAGAETSKRWDWENTQAKLFKWNIKNLSLSQIQQIGGLFINQGKNVFSTFLAAKSVVDGDLTLGGMMSVQYMLGQFNSPIEQLTGLIQSWQDAQMSVERLNEIHELNDEESVSNGNRPSWDGRRDIHFNKVTYTYPGAGNEPVLIGIDFVIPEGKTTAIVGTSGSGKTTLLKLLLRFYEPQKGRIALGAKISGEYNNTGEETFITTDLKNMSYRKWRQGCGVVMQDGFIFSDSVARNIAVTDEIIDQEKLFEAARVANIHDFIQSLPLSYYTKIGVEGTGLSQGQKQRILIARAVYKSPQLLLFDEATNALDSLNESIIVGNLKTFLKGRTVVIVAHRLSTVRDADQIIVLEKGRLVEKGSHTDLLHKKGKYFELISNQLELGAS